MSVSRLLSSAVLALALVPACGEGVPPYPSWDGDDTGDDTDTDSGTDGDADSDADGDADSDADSDADGDADGDADSDADGDADSDADGDADSDADSDADGDTDTEYGCAEAFMCLIDGSDYWGCLSNTSGDAYSLMWDLGSCLIGNDCLSVDDMMSCAMSECPDEAMACLGDW